MSLSLKCDETLNWVLICVAWLCHALYHNELGHGPHLAHLSLISEIQVSKCDPQCIFFILNAYHVIFMIKLQELEIVRTN